MRAPPRSHRVINQAPWSGRRDEPPVCPVPRVIAHPTESLAEFRRVFLCPRPLAPASAQPSLPRDRRRPLRGAILSGTIRLA